MKLKLNKLFFLVFKKFRRNINKSILFYFNRDKYDEQLRRKCKLDLQNQIRLWMEHWRNQCEATGLNYWDGYRTGYDEGRTGKEPRVKI